MEKRADVFQAISAPVRREIIHALATTGDQSISEIAIHHAMSRQAVTRHIQVLEQSGIVKIRKSGREQICSFNAQALKEIYRWVTFYEQFWDAKLDALEDYLRQNRRNTQ